MMNVRKSGFGHGCRNRGPIRVIGGAMAGAALVAMTVVGSPASAMEPLSVPQEPPARICGNSDLLRGPAAPPAGAIVVPAGDNSTFDFNRPGVTFWFAPGVHTLGSELYGQIIAQPNTSYIGGPDAVIDGQNLNKYAFTKDVSGVTVRYLTIRNFGTGFDNNDEGVVNHDAGSDWVVEYNTISDNDGAGLFVGSGNVVRFNCLKDNGQYGFSAFRPPVEGQPAIADLTLDRNEITGNNTDDWESRREGCGCTGASKFWDVRGARVTNNWIHDNRGPGLWADTNNIDFLIEGNYIDGNDGEGIFYEISYNATIRNNLIRNNGWVKGKEDQGSPAPGIYISESGGDARLASAVSGAAALRIYDNRFENNFSGVAIHENANRFCNSNGNTSKAWCTPFVSPTIIPKPHNEDYPNPINADHPCAALVAQEPYRSNCRWNAQNVEVYSNDFLFDPALVPCFGQYCGVQALHVRGDDNIPWAPYTVQEIQEKVMFGANNRFHDNRYFGPWRFVHRYNEVIYPGTWTSAPLNQDPGSTFDGGPPPPPPPPPPPGPVANYLDADTSGLEGSLGEWQDWFSATIGRQPVAAHSGSSGLSVQVTAPYGWGVQLGNWPGFEIFPGPKRVSYWAKRDGTRVTSATMRVRWFDASQQVIGESAVPVTISGEWQQAIALVEAPAGAATVNLDVYGASENAGEILFFDDFVVGDADAPQ